MLLRCGGSPGLSCLEVVGSMGFIGVCGSRYGGSGGVVVPCVVWCLCAWLCVACSDGQVRCMPMFVSCCGVFALKESIEVFASVGTLPVRRFCSRMSVSRCMSLAAWCRRLLPMSDLEHFGVAAIGIRAVPSMCDLLIWAESSFLGDAMRFA